MEEETKRNTWGEREGDLPRLQEQRRRECDAEAHRNARCDPARRQLEQERNTAAHQGVCMEDPERRRDEQEPNTAARQRVCMEEPERRRDEQE